MEISLVEQYVTKLFENGRKDLIYHDINHTKTVVAKVEQACDDLKLTTEARLIILVAAWFHDVGYLEKYSNHEEQSVQEFKKYARSIDADESKVNEKIIGCIRATEMKAIPTNDLEKLLKDIDIAYALYTDFQQEGNKLRQELEVVKNCTYENIDWNHSQKQFLKKIEFMSKYGSEQFQYLLDQELKKLE